MSNIDDAVLSHHREAATMWAQGGKDCDEVSYAISDALKHAAQRLAAARGRPHPRRRDGTGWSARNAARRGAQVIGVDIAEDLLEAARFPPMFGRRLSSGLRMPSACRSRMRLSTG